MKESHVSPKPVSKQGARVGSRAKKAPGVSAAAHARADRRVFGLKLSKPAKKKLYDFLLYACIFVLVVSVCLLINTLWQRHEIKDEEQADAASAALIASERSTAQAASAAELQTVTETEAFAETDTTAETENVPLSPEFSRLYGINSDFIGILRFADMSLYVCRGRDNEYYLTHKFDGSENPAGMVFLDASCVFESGDNYLLHGHNMDDGSRFGKLKRYLRRTYLDAHPVFSFDTILGNHEYRVAAVFKASFISSDANYFYYQKARFESKAEYDAYLARAKQLSAVDTGFTPAYGKPLLILSTCTDRDTERLVVLCGEV